VPVQNVSAADPRSERDISCVICVSAVLRVGRAQAARPLTGNAVTRMVASSETTKETRLRLIMASHCLRPGFQRIRSAGSSSIASATAVSASSLSSWVVEPEVETELFVQTLSGLQGDMVLIASPAAARLR